ncbi:serine/threonine protein kinase [Saccharothrix stipae]
MDWELGGRFYPGEVIDDRYEVRDVLGSGASGEVYAVYDRDSSRDLTLKIQPPRFLESTRYYADGSRMIKKEASTSWRLREVEGLVHALNQGDHHGRRYYVMQEVGGRDLTAFVEGEGPVSSVRTAAVITQLCAVVGELHVRGWTHRDLKLDNSLIDDNGRVWLIDLGSAVRIGSERYPAGTPGYTAPEIIDGAPSTAVSDIFSLGCLLFGMSIMRLPYINKTGGKPATVSPFSDDLLPALEALDSTVREVGLRMIASDPTDRPRSTQEVVETLRPVLPDSSAAPRPGRKPDPVRWYWLSTFRRDADS